MKAKFLATFVVALLSACGGGSSSPAPTPVAAAPTATLASIAPAAGATDVATDAKVVLTLAVTNATASDASKLAFLCNNKATSFVPASVVANGISTSILTPTAALTNGESCTVSGDIVTTGPGGSVTTPISTSFTVVAAPTCAAPKVWSTLVKTCVYPVGVKVVGAISLPSGCLQTSQACWKASFDVTTKIVSSGATIGGRAIVFDYFKSSVDLISPGWNGLPMYADTSVLVDPTAAINGGTSSEVDWVQGSTKGLIVHDKASGVCYEASYIPALVVAIVTCP